jgi:hypothetical protein
MTFDHLWLTLLVHESAEVAHPLRAQGPRGGVMRFEHSCLAHHAREIAEVSR